MKQRELSTKKGFTIIEVVLVLAIAGLIFLMVFLALPALQRNQRDTQRKNDVSIVGSAITNYTSNNRGKMPAPAVVNSFPVTATTGWSSYLKELSSAVASVSVIAFAAPGDSGATTDTIVAVTGAQCGADVSDGKYVKGSSARKSAVFMRLENGDAFYCQDV